MLETLLAVVWWPLSWLLRPLPLAVIAILLTLAYRRITRDHAFWTSRGVPGPPPTFLSGHNFPNPRCFYEFDQWLYYEQGGKKMCGFIEMMRPVLYVGDPDLIRAITIKDFDHFVDRRDLVISKCMEDMMPSLRGRKWKEVRAIMSPAFSSSKLKAMHELCLESADNLSNYLQETTRQHGDVEMKEAAGRFTMDNIASCAFGVNCNSFKDPNTEFASVYDSLRLALLMVLPRWLGQLLPERSEAAAEFFRRVVLTTIAHREGAGDAGRRDYLHLLLEARQQHGEHVLSNDSIVANCVLFYVAGYDTTATVITFACYALATEPAVQAAARDELDQVLARHGGRLTYEAVSELRYLDRVISETLRLYSPSMRIERECSRDYRVPGTELTLPAGTLVAMPVITMHRDPEYFPDPMRFDPDRFLPEEKEKRHPCVYIPFGSGPRNCIAQRFALFEIKVALACVLRDCRLEKAPATPPAPLRLEPTAFLSTPADPVRVRVVPRTDRAASGGSVPAAEAPTESGPASRPTESDPAPRPGTAAQ
ncbi:cytochrome P450 9e2-like [Amphibalanus amphitrite]|uniref:cytochrome P450 9e2-like n=1 Tax=Amphibalanus amphitrite TaxID=1232801 RepID=UPI001C90336E|nr:cytochrome P450 9e2-like [Amphibalanus amphitrite]